MSAGDFDSSTRDELIGVSDIEIGDTAVDTSP